MKMGETEEDIEKNRRDPFLQPPILKVFFELLPVEDLAKCRLVSKLWYDLSLSTWRSNATVTIEGDGLSETEEVRDRCTPPLGEFLDHWEADEWGSPPFKKFNLYQWIFKAGDVEQERFLELVGSNITSLILHECSFIGRDNFRRVLYQAFPKLQFLKMYTCDDGENDDINDHFDPRQEILEYKEPAFGLHGLKSLDISGGQRLLHSMLDMLSHFHKITSLHVEVDSDSYTYEQLLETIRLIRAQNETKLPLKNFDVNFSFEFPVESGGQGRDYSIKLLKFHEQLKLPLQRLKIWVGPEREMSLDSINVIRDIVKYHFSTLKQLNFIGHFGNREFCNAFPFGVTLEKLENLVIKIHRFSNNLNYLRFTPNLRVLEVWDPNLSLSESDNLFSNSPQLEIEDWTLPALTKLILRFPLSACNWRKLMKWMPNVEWLWGVKRLNDEELSLVCKNWKNLKDLMDWGTELTDEGVIGRGNGQEPGGDEETQCDPNITQLKNLTSFWTRSSNLTSASVTEGFLKLGSLKQLTLGKDTKLDDEAKAALERREIKFSLIDF